MTITVTITSHHYYHHHHHCRHYCHHRHYDHTVLTITFTITPTVLFSITTANTIPFSTTITIIIIISAGGRWALPGQRDKSSLETDGDGRRKCKEMFKWMEEE